VKNRDARTDYQKPSPFCLPKAKQAKIFS